MAPSYAMRIVKQQLENAGALIYPPTCLSCGSEDVSSTGICGTCWTDTQAIRGAYCDQCGTMLPTGEDAEDLLICDDCLTRPKNWSKGRAAFVYSGAAKRLVMALKHGDRQDLVPFMAHNMGLVGKPLLEEADLIIPVPLHWTRAFRRTFNQAALLAKALSEREGTSGRYAPMILKRAKPTQKQEHMTRDARFALQSDAFAIHPKRANHIEGKTILLVDDVMTSGATLTACTDQLSHAGAATVNVLVFARVVMPI